MILDGLALIESDRFSATANPGATWTIPSNTLPGDLLIVCQLVENSSGTIPTDVIPSGWTSLDAGTTGVSAASKGCRVRAVYRIAQAGDANTVVTGMNGASKNRVCGIRLHFNRPIRTAATPSNSIDFATGLPTAQVITWNGVMLPHLYVGWAHGDANVSDSNFSWSSGPIGSSYNVGGTPDLGAATATRTWYSFFPQGVTPTSSITMSMTADTGDFNAVGGAIIRLT